MHEQSYLLLVDICKDDLKREEQMQIDGGNLDDDKIERDWYQLNILTTIQVSQQEVYGMFEQGLLNCCNHFYERYRDVR